MDVDGDIHTPKKLQTALKGLIHSGGGVRCLMFDSEVY